MIKIKKDIDSVPNSLQFPIADFFPNGIPAPALTTNKRRLEIIKNKGYLDQPIYNSRYKQADTQTLLRSIYKNKCAFCEQKVEQSHVEHYRPKSKYYWLVYSWDNLLLACSTCNLNKDVHFEILGKEASFYNIRKNIKKINNLSAEHDLLEKPKMVNPEKTDPNGKVHFKRNGLITSSDIRFKYTIEKCKIDRKYLNDERRKILDIFQRDVVSAITDNPTISEQESEISVIVKKFLRDSQDGELQFLGFRRYTVSNWLTELVIEAKLNL